jgi:hypothetical protein
MNKMKEGTDIFSVRFDVDIAYKARKATTTILLQPVFVRRHAGPQISMICIYFDEKLIVAIVRREQLDPEPIISRSRLIH